ncbi:hypothetical protein ABZT28_21795, partial [Streptomyces sp. NPDC005388]
TTHPNHPTTLHATFHHYTEHHTPTYITTHTTDDTDDTDDTDSSQTPTTHITAHQNNTTVFTAQLTTHTPTDTT